MTTSAIPVGSAGLQSLANAGNGFEVVRTMRAAQLLNKLFAILF